MDKLYNDFCNIVKSNMFEHIPHKTVLKNIKMYSNFRKKDQVNHGGILH